MAERNEKEMRKGRGSNPNSRANLKPFSSDNPPKNNGRPKGSKDRKSLLRYWLEQNVKVKNQNTKGAKIFQDLPDEIEGTIYDQIVLGIIKRAMGGDVSAYREIQDSMHGKVPDKLESEINANVALKSVDEFNKEAEKRLKETEKAVKKRNE